VLAGVGRAAEPAGERGAGDEPDRGRVVAVVAEEAEVVLFPGLVGIYSSVVDVF